MVVSCDIGFVKPHSLMFEAVCQRLELPPEAVLHVGDDLEADIAGAKRYGMRSAYTSQFCPTVETERIAAAGPDFLVSNLDEVLTLLT